MIILLFIVLICIFQMTERYYDQGGTTATTVEITTVVW